MKKNQDTFIIYNGAIDIYYPLKIETKLSFGDLYDTIAESVKSFLVNYKKQAYSGLSEEFEDVIKEQELQGLKVKKSKTDQVSRTNELLK